MGQIYLIPDRERIADSLALAEEYGAAFEYNDFYSPEVLDNEKLKDDYINFYLRQGRDCSQDTMHGAFLDITIHSEDPLIREASELRIRQSMEIAQNMGLRGVVFHTGRLAGFRVDYYIKNWLRTNEAFFRQMLAEFPEQQIFMENMFDESGDILAELAQRMADIPRFGVCMDYAHLMLAPNPPQEWVRLLAPYVRHMHINDNDLCNDLHQEVGQGKIDWQVFGELMAQYHVDASVLVEIKNVDLQRKSLSYMKEHKIYPLEADM